MNIEGLVYAIIFWVVLVLGYELVISVAESGSWLNFIGA